jgi:hypothetical protein
MRILSFDPGGSNYAYAQIEISTRHPWYKVVSSGMIQHTIKDIKGEVKTESLAYQREIKSLLKFKPDSIFAERYLLRQAVTGGTTTEGINMMLGILTVSSGQVPLRYITAALWKNAYNRMFGKAQLKQDYKLAKGICTPHQMDAALIGIFGMYSLSDTKPFEDFKIETLLKQLKKCQK